MKILTSLSLMFFYSLSICQAYTVSTLAGLQKEKIDTVSKCKKKCWRRK